MDNLKIYSADENIIKFTKENGAIYINYVSRGSTRVTAEYKFNGELYVVECAIRTWDWDLDEDESQDENNQDTTSTTNPDENNNNSNQTEQTTTTIETPKQENESKNNNTNVENKTETPKQENEKKNNNTNVETKTETQTKSTTINTNKNENSIFNNTETQNDSNDFLLDSENKLVDTEYNNYTFNSEDEIFNVEDSLATNDEINEQKLATSKKTKSNTPSSKNTGIIIIGMAVISVVIIASIILAKLTTIPTSPFLYPIIAPSNTKITITISKITIYSPYMLTKYILFEYINATHFSLLKITISFGGKVISIFFISTPHLLITCNLS